MLIINFVILAYSLFDFNSSVRSMSVYAIFIGLMINFIWQLWGMIIEIRLFLKREVLEQHDAKFDFSQIKPSKKECDLGYKVISSNTQEPQYAFVSEKINHMLRTKTFKIKKDLRKEKNLKKYICKDFANYYYFLKYQVQKCSAASVYFYNEKKLCLAHDIEESDAICCFKSCYYATHITHFTFNKYIIDEDDNIIAQSRPSKAITDRRLWDISTSKASNQIGISTLGFTKNGYLILLTQGKRANFSNNLLVPTGSGSADWKDYNHDSFHAAVVHAMNRELFEEIGHPRGYSPKTIGETKLLGFFRRVNFLGKPEFVGITRMNIANTAIYPDKKEMKNDCNAMEEYKVFDPEKSIVFFDEIISILKEKTSFEGCSFSLFMCIHILLKYLDTQQGREEFQNFILKKDKKAEY